jgi:hypothetical protein
MKTGSNGQLKMRTDPLSTRQCELERPPTDTWPAWPKPVRERGRSNSVICFCAYSAKCPRFAADSRAERRGCLARRRRFWFVLSAAHGDGESRLQITRSTLAGSAVNIEQRPADFEHRDSQSTNHTYRFESHMRARIARCPEQANDRQQRTVTGPTDAR